MLLGELQGRKPFDTGAGQSPWRLEVAAEGASSRCEVCWPATTPIVGLAQGAADTEGYGRSRNFFFSCWLCLQLVDVPWLGMEPAQLQPEPQQ